MTFLHESPGQQPRPVDGRPHRASAGTLSTRGAQMKYEHGQHAAYVIDKCRCAPCSAANSKYERDRKSNIEPAYVGADPARQHVRFLAEHGMGLKTVAKLSGVPHGSLAKLVHGDKRRGMGPSKRMRKRNLDRILAVMPSSAPDGTRDDAAPILALVAEMVVAGVPKVRIAQHIGQRGPGLQLGSQRISARNARAIRELHAQWAAGKIELVRRDRWGAETAAPPPAREPNYIDRSAILLDLCEVLESRNEQPWRSLAACRNRPPHIWFPARGDHRCLAKAREICGACIVRGECLAANLDAIDGVYAGTTGHERREMRRIEMSVA